MRILLLLLCLFATMARAENLYFRPPFGTSASTNGLAWDTAWTNWNHIKWGSGAGSLGGGDTLWVAGGTHFGRLQIGASGSSTATIFIKRATASDSAATSASGWDSSFDSQVLQTNGTSTSLIYFASGIGSHVWIDGRTTNGWLIRFSDAGRGVEIDNTSSGVGYISNTFRYLRAWGPGPITQTGDTRGFDLTIVDSITNLVMQYCESSHGDTTCQITGNYGTLMEHCIFHDADAVNAATFHPNILYLGQTVNAVIRFNTFYNVEVEGIFFGGGSNTGDEIYGNLWFEGTSNDTGRGIENDATATISTIKIYNNTFIDLNNGPISFTGGSASGVASNNIYFNTGGLTYGSVSHDYNYSSGANSEANGVASGTAPFVDAANWDYHIISTISSTKPRDKGVVLGTSYNTDMDGVTRGGDGTWDIGAFEYTAGGGGGGGPDYPTVPTQPRVSTRIRLNIR